MSIYLKRGVIDLFNIPSGEMKHPEQAIEKEWLVTNFLGGFASSSIILCNTRRYHGLLNISSNPPYNRYHTVSSIDEEILIDGESFKLGVNQYPGVFNPTGYKYLQNFQFDLFPLFSYKLDTVYLEKEIFMVPFKNEVIINYRFLNAFEKELKFYFRPYFSIRSIHDLVSDYLAEIKNPRIEKNEFSLEVDWFLHPIRVRSTAGLWKKSFKDLQRVIYKKEAQRGLEFNEDLYSPAYLEFSSKKQRIEFSLRISAEILSDFDPYHEKQNFINEKNKFMNKAGAVEEVDRILLNDASNFISLKKIDRDNFTKTIIAGYPWFEDWGRDTMISIPGLLLETNQTEVAFEILKDFSKHIKKGLVPNYFSSYSAPSFNTADASLWFFIAIWEYYKKTNDIDLIRKEFLKPLNEIMKSYLHGTSFGIYCDKSDMLISQGEEGAQLTWMDAKVGDKVFTPRAGKPIEIQGLWYNALMILSKFTEDKTVLKRLKENSEKVKNSILKKFWLKDKGYLADVVRNDNSIDDSLRPNALIAVSFPFSFLDSEKHKQMLQVITEKLLTINGLRSLSQDNPEYIGYYEGDRYMRDSAYHQGTVWSWLIGPYIFSMLKYNKDNDNIKNFCRKTIDNILTHLNDGCLGSISEIFDGEFPFRARGCFAQAWSTAELIRVRKLLRE